MICPRCNTNLVLTNSQGIEIDHCANCKGVWLDRGELEKIIEQSNGAYNAGCERYSHQDNHQDRHYGKHHDDDYDDHYERRNENQPGFGQDNYRNQSGRRKGFFAELFDF